MLLYNRTSLLTSSAQTLVNTVNCVGVMGKGLAAEFRKRYPDMFPAYKEVCDNKHLKPGGLWLWQGPDHLILNFATKNHWRSPSRLEWIELGLRTFRAEYERFGISEISFPRLGCGNGGLDWTDVRPLMERHLSDLPIQIFIHDFEVDIGIPEHKYTNLPIRNVRSLLSSYDDFIETLRSIVADHNISFTSPRTQEKFSARFDDATNNLVVATGSGNQTIDQEDLRSVWLAALSGIISRHNITVSTDYEADLLMGVISAVPDARIIQIKYWDSEQPEIAIDVKKTHQAASIGDAYHVEQKSLWD